MNSEHNSTQQALPFDDEMHEPIPYVLTAAAHREVAQGDVPPLQVVVDDADERDTRPARARALRRGGLPISEIADRLGADELLVRGWVDDGPSSLRSRDAPHRRSTRTFAVQQHAADEPGVEEATGIALARAAAAADARSRLGDNPGFAAGVGLIAGIAEFDDSGLILRLSSTEVAARSAEWLGTYAEIDPGTMRVVLRLGSRAAGDVARHRWAAALGMPGHRVAVVRSRQLVDPGSVQALLRVADPAVSTMVAGWCDALLSSAEEPVDLAF